MKAIRLKVKTNSGNYPIIIGLNLLPKFSNFLYQNSIKFEKCLLVVDKNVPRKKIGQIKKVLKKKKVFIKFIQANEKNKNQKNLDIIIKILLKENFSKSSSILSNVTLGS